LWYNWRAADAGAAAELAHAIYAKHFWLFEIKISTRANFPETKKYFSCNLLVIAARPTGARRVPAKATSYAIFIWMFELIV
jgi:hypothetical protein